MSTVRELLKTKGREIWSISPQETVYRALEIMADKDIGALLVMEDGKLVGIFTERDYARKVILKGKSSKETTVNELMTRNVLCISPETTIQECLALMSSRQFRHLPVLDYGRVVGIITLGDAVKRIMSEQEFTIQELEKYVISG